MLTVLQLKLSMVWGSLPASPLHPTAGGTQRGWGYLQPENGAQMPPPSAPQPYPQLCHPYLTEAELPIEVFIHLLDHVLQPQVGLRGSQLFHHQFQLHQINVPIPS